MTATKISELTAATTIAPTDLIPIVSDPSGSPTTKKITANNLANSMLSNVQVTILPNANVTYNLGSSTKAWNNVYLKTLYANGTAGSNGFILVSNGSVAYWSNTASFTTNVSAQYTFTNNITFSGTVTFTSNIIGTANNSLYLGGIIASSYQLNSTLAANVATMTANNADNLGAIAAAGYQRTSTLVANVATMTANNADNLGGTAAASYQLNSTLAANVATMTANNANNLGGTAAASYQLNSTLAANVATMTANNANNLGGTVAANYVQNTDSRTLSGNLYFTGTNVYFDSLTSANVIFSDTTIQNTAFQKVAAPANSTATGTTNQIAWDSNSIYICVATNTWKKVDITSF